MPIASVNPATGETLRTYEPLSEAQIGEKLRRSAERFQSYRGVPFSERARLLSRAAEILEQEKDHFGRLMTSEMGKPLKAAREEAAKCAWACRYYAGNGERLLAEEPVDTGVARTWVRYEPLGPVLAIMPWNFPFWQVFRFAAPTLMAGNVGLLKHASNVPQCALAIEDIFLRAGFPEGAFQTLLIGSSQVPRVIDDPRVRAVTLTGSDRAGSEVGATAGRQIKKSVLELGGSDPFIVMPSADLDAAVATAVRARVINNGQSCIAAKRFIVASEVAEDFTPRFVRAMEALRVGDPMEEDTELGPLATPEILATLDEQVRKSVDAGALLLTGGKRLDRPGNYYAPTVLANVPAGSPAWCEELFGPVAAVFPARDIDEAIRIANATDFGLGSSVWTNDDTERRRFIGEIEAGMVFVNAMVASDPRLPFGGVKRSGYGRELSVYGVREFVNIKTVWVKEAPAVARTATE
jgi:succinate-semialdehyde dehydrogenase/glutarate-semialdehyde dehydrogenase